MIAGVGTDLVDLTRMRSLHARYGRRAAERILHPGELADFDRARDPARFLATHFAAKEAFAKALGTGLVAPASLCNIGVGHDQLGRPLFHYAAALAELMTRRALVAHLSLSDEPPYALAFVVLEQA